MRVTYDTWSTQFASPGPSIFVDGKLIKNVSMADDRRGIVEYVKGKKIETIKGVVEIKGERI